MKILFVTSWYPDRLSAYSGIFIQNQARFVATRHEVFVLSNKVDYTKFHLCKYELSHERNAGVEEYRLIVYRSLPLINQLIYLAASLRVAIRIGRTFKPDVIHASIGYPGAFLGWVLGKYLGVPFLFQEHTRPTNNFRSFFHKWTAVAGMRRAFKVVAVSQFLGKDLQQLLNRHVYVLPNAIDLQPFFSIQRKEREMKRIGFLGGMNTPVKGVDILLKSVAILSDKNVHLYVCGDGKLRKDYEKLAADLGISNRCHFYGFITRKDITAFYENLDLFVCSSRYETFNVSLVEAMASGLPVVSTRCGGPEEFVTPDAGVLCEKESPEDLARAIREVLSQLNLFNPDTIKRSTFQRFNQQNYLEQFDNLLKDSSAL